MWLADIHFVLQKLDSRVAEDEKLEAFSYEKIYSSPVTAGPQSCFYSLFPAFFWLKKIMLHFFPPLFPVIFPLNPAPLTPTLGCNVTFQSHSALCGCMQSSFRLVAMWLFFLGDHQSCICSDNSLSATIGGVKCLIAPCFTA